MSKLTPQSKTAQRARRHLRLRARVIGTAERPRLAVYRSNKFVYAQLIDDDRAHTIASARVTGKKVSQMEQAKIVGAEIAVAAKKLGVTKVVFDRGGFQYAGRIMALAEAARAEGLQF